MSCADKPRPNVGQAYLQIKECLDGRSFLVVVTWPLCAGRRGSVAVGVVALLVDRFV